MSLAIPGYDILRPIAEGGMASVYLAEQKSLGRYIALKLLKRFDNPDEATRFRNEGRIVASLNHRNIITIHDIGAHEDRHFISMEYLEGGDLERQIQSGMSADAALDLLSVMGGCLDFLHGKGIIHRDIKPANILFHRDGTPILSDFGVARDLAVDKRLTMQGSAVGSPYYLSPEQAECKPLDGRTDIYSLGIIFHEMLTGEKPFQGDSHIETIVAHLTEPLPSLPPEHARYQGLLERMIAKDPGDRFADAGTMLNHIRRIRRRTTAGFFSPGKYTESGCITRHANPASRRRISGTLAQSVCVALGKLAAHYHGSARQRWIAGTTVAALLATSALLFTSAPPTSDRAGDESRSLMPDTPAVHASISREYTLSPGINPAEQAAMPPATDSEVSHPAVAVAFQAGEGSKLSRSELLSRARRALEQFRLTTPSGDNAYYYYNGVLQLDPEDEEARAGVRRIAESYAELAEQARDRFQFARARSYIDRGLEVDPDNPRLLALEHSNDIKKASQNALNKVRALFK